MRSRYCTVEANHRDARRDDAGFLGLRGSSFGRGLRDGSTQAGSRDKVFCASHVYEHVWTCRMTLSCQNDETVTLPAMLYRGWRSLLNVLLGAASISRVLWLRLGGGCGPLDPSGQCRAWRHEASRGLSATAELFVHRPILLCSVSSCISFRYLSCHVWYYISYNLLYDSFMYG